jgi:spore coat protein U-like protein
LATRWGDGNPEGGGAPQTFTSDGNANVLTAYGKIPSNQTGQDLSVGNYSDTVTVTVTY